MPNVWKAAPMCEDLPNTDNPPGGGPAPAPQEGEEWRGLHNPDEHRVTGLYGCECLNEWCPDLECGIGWPCRCCVVAEVASLCDGSPLAQLRDTQSATPDTTEEDQP